MMKKIILIGLLTIPSVNAQVTVGGTSIAIFFLGLGFALATFFILRDMMKTGKK